jgi:hypothetical protein
MLEHARGDVIGLTDIERTICAAKNVDVVQATTMPSSSIDVEERVQLPPPARPFDSPDSSLAQGIRPVGWLAMSEAHASPKASVS